MNLIKCLQLLRKLTYIRRKNNMAMSDCPRCWNTPCTCGYMGYDVKYQAGPSRYEQDREKDRLMERIKNLKINWPH